LIFTASYKPESEKLPRAIRRWRRIHMIHASHNIALLKSVASQIGGTPDAAQIAGAKIAKPNSVETERQPDDDPSDEAAVLSAAIQRLISERDRHRSRAVTQEAELISLRAINGELRRQNEGIVLLRDHYLRLATELVTQLKQIDTAIREAVQKTHNAASELAGKLNDRDSNLISLARRLSPIRAPANGR